MRITMFFVALFLCAFLAGCSQEPPAESGTAANENNENRVSEQNEDRETAINEKIMSAAVSIHDSGYRPKEVTIDAGGTVKWTNSGSRDHTVQGDAFPQKTSQDKKYSGRLTPGMSWEKTFDSPGYYNYYDIYDDSLKGKVIVR